MMELKRYDFVLEAVQPIAHHQETFGNSAVIFRQKIRLPDGSFADVPYLTGDSIRHQLREAIAYAFLDAAGMLDQGKLTEAALRLLFAGGMVTGRGDASTIKLDQFREMVELVPALGLLGGCVSNRVVEGRIIVDSAMLACDETAHLLPEWVRAECAPMATCRAFVSEEQRVRMDPTLSPTKRKLLSASEQTTVQARLLTSETAHASDDAIARADAKSSMMPRSQEVVIIGARFWWTVEAWCTSDLDVDTLHSMIGAFLANARVGGKRGTGHGLLRAVAARGMTVNRPAQSMDVVDALALSSRVGETFRKHVADRRERIATFLGSVDA